MDRETFLAEIEAVCRKHGLVIAHEDRHGEFVIDPLTEEGLEWLRTARFDEFDQRRVARPQALTDAAVVIGDIVG